MWSAPVVLSQTAAADDGTCTPKCHLTGTPQFSATASGSCGSQLYTVTVTPAVVPGSAECPCGNSGPVVGGLTGTFPKGDRGEKVITGQVSVTCSDSAGDPCATTCTLTVTVDITGNPGNSCAQNNVSVVSVSSSC